jgi:hypothetical protein
MNTKFAYPCLKCSHSEVIDFANPPKTCTKCGEPLPKLELPVELESTTNPPKPEKPNYVETSSYIEAVAEEEGGEQDGLQPDAETEK